MGLRHTTTQFKSPQIMRFAHQTHMYSDLKNTNDGSIVFEISTGYLSNKEHLAVSCKSGQSQYFQLSLYPSEDKILVRAGANGKQIEFPLCNTPLDNLAKLRITFSWSQHENTSLLTAEDLSSGQVFQAEINCAVPLSAKLLTQLHTATQDTQIASSISFVGVSGRKEPVGMPLSISRDALIETPTGLAPIQHLKIGDLVQTLENGLQPIRWIGSQNAPALGAFCPIELRAPYHFINQNIFTHPKQRILVKNTNVEYLFGIESALIEVRHLLDNVSAICQPENGKTHQLFHILFDNHEIINVSGCFMESMFIGNIVDDPSLLKTTVLKCANPTELPRHTQKARPFLKPYEAKILLAEMRR